VILLLALLVGLGLMLDEFRVSLVSQYLALALMALSLDLIWGYAGILSFGQAAFFGFGAYGVGLMLTHVGTGGLYLAVPIGLVAAIALAALLGLFVFYSRVGLFFIAVITLAVSVILDQIVNQFSSFTGGFNGIQLPVGFTLDVRTTYFVVLGAFASVLVILALIVRSDFGRVLVAIRDNEERVRFLGFRTPRIKVSLLALAGLIAAGGGILYSLQTFLVSPSLVGFVLSTQAVIWVAIGGRGTLVGPALGVILINLGQEELSGVSLSYWQLTLGGLLIVVVLFAQDGLYPLLLRLLRTGRHIEMVELMPESSPRNVDIRDAAGFAVRGLSKRFGSFEALSRVDLDLRDRELLCLIGPNGAGKSTLVDTITGRTTASSGTIEVEGAALPAHVPERIVARGICRTFQAGTVFGSLTVFDNLALASKNGSVHARDLVLRTRRLVLPARIHGLVRAAGLDQRLADKAQDLSHGEKKWLELCMVLAQEPRVILLDEPTAGLADLDRRWIGSALREIVERDGVSLVLIEHDLDFVRQVGDRVVVLNRGRVAFEGAVEDAAASPLVRELYLGVAVA
jgi:branched-chain amino acid transport system permease protein